MARSSGGDALLKKNSKLETFLKKALPERTVDRIRGYESCIVVSEQENKAFKYVVLGDEWIYLTENPPSKIQQSVWLGDVISVDLVNDFPEFLSGEERENSQHLAVRFLTAISRRRSLRKSRRPTNGSLHETDRSNASTPQGSLLEDFGYATQSTSSLYAGGSRPNSQNSLKDKITSGLSKKVKKPGSVSQESSEDHVKGGREAIEEERLEDIEECDLFDRSYDSSFTNRKNYPLNSSRLESKLETGERFLKKSASSTSNGKTRPPPKCPEIVTTQPTTGTSPNGWPSENKFGDEDPGCCLQGLCKSRSKSRPATFVSSAKSRIRQNSIGPVTACELELGMSRDDLTNRDDVSEIIEVPNIKSLTTPRNSADIGGRGTLSPRTPAPSSRMSTPFLRSVSGTPLGDLSQDNRSLLMVPDSVSMNGEVFGDKRVAVLNIYLLTLSSPMLMLMRSACNNFMIRATLMLDPEFEKNYKAGAVRATYNHLEKMDVLFGQLKRELFRPGNSLADIYDLTNELKIAAERNFALKKIFWKNSDMFPYFVQLIQSYLPTSRTNLNTVAGRKQRHDEIELVILLTEIISIMFRETELIPARFQALKAQRGKAVLDLLRVLTCTPEIPEKQVAPSGRAAELIQSFQDEGYSSAAASEVTRLLSDFTEVSLTTVFELFLMAKQANWNQTSDNFLNIFWMVQVLEELSTTERYVERVIRQTMSLISPSRVDPLTPQEAVTLYQQFSVILVFLTYSPRVTFFIRNNYTEEFKYFVQPAAIERKLSPSYPITRVTLRLIEDVLSQVLEMPGSSLSVTPR